MRSHNKSTSVDQIPRRHLAPIPVLSCALVQRLSCCFPAAASKLRSCSLQRPHLKADYITARRQRLPKCRCFLLFAGFERHVGCIVCCPPLPLLSFIAQWIIGWFGVEGPLGCVQTSTYCSFAKVHFWERSVPAGLTASSAQQLTGSRNMWTTMLMLITEVLSTDAIRNLYVLIFIQLCFKL